MLADFNHTVIDSLWEWPIVTEDNNVSDLHELLDCGVTF